MSLTSNELKLMSQRGHDGYLIGRVSSAGAVVVGKIPDDIPYEYEFVPFIGMDGRQHRIRRLELSSATRAEVEIAYAREVERRANNLAENKTAPKMPPVTPFRRATPKPQRESRKV